MDCLFCKIIAGEIPCTKIYEDDLVLAFLDIKPVHPGHTLVIPKTHASTLFAMDQALVKSWAAAIQNIAKAVVKGTGAHGFNLELNDGSAAGQLVPHVHMHIVPRFDHDGLRHWPGTAYQNAAEAQTVAEKIKKNFQF
ncbi:MAG TPA: HIT family protein [Patescibacteria group bacterium]|nr:HIT family protein [Patescibacteria group bacterium]